MNLGVPHSVEASAHHSSAGFKGASPIIWARGEDGLKNGLRKVLLERSRVKWDLYMPYIAMGYRMSKLAAVGYSP